MNINFDNVAKHYAQKTFDQMKAVLMDPAANAPAVFYHMIRGTKDSGNVTVLEPGTVGGEYIKTVGHYHIGDLKETYFIKNGQGVALLQKLALDASGKAIPNIVAEFKAIPFKEGDNVFMPGGGWGHVIVNTDKKYLVTIDDTIVYFDENEKPKNSGHADYELVQQMKGFCYYVVEKEGGPCLIKNKNYKEVRTADFGGLEASSD